MVTAIIVAATFAAVIFALGIAVGLGPARFVQAVDWVGGHVAMAALGLFVGGVAAGEWIRKQATKAWRRAWKR